MYIPKNEDHKRHLIMEVAQARRESPDNVHTKFVSFGHLYGFDVARTAAMTYVGQRGGKACLSAEGIKSLVFQSGKLLYIRYIEQSAERCIIEVKRTDFPSDLPPQRFEYNWQDAVMAGNANQLNYKKMPSAMLTARCWVKMARDYFSDVVAGFYSIDEIMDGEVMDDQERAMIAAESMGEVINLSSSPQTQRPPQPSRQPQPQRAPQPTPAPQPEISVEDQSISVKPQRERVPPVTHCSRPTPLNGFETIDNLKNTCLFNKISLHEANECNLRLGARLDHMSESERIEYFYRWLLSTTLRNSKLTDQEWWRDSSNHRHIFAQLREEFPILEQVSESDIGKSLGRRDFWEAVKVTVHMPEDKLRIAYNSIESLTRNSEDGTTSTADYLASL